MKIPKPILIVILGVHFTATMVSFGFIMDLTARWNACETMAVLGIWTILVAVIFYPILNRLIWEH